MNKNLLLENKIITNQCENNSSNSNSCELHELHELSSKLKESIYNNIMETAKVVLAEEIPLVVDKHLGFLYDSCPSMFTNERVNNLLQCVHGLDQKSRLKDFFYTEYINKIMSEWIHDYFNKRNKEKLKRYESEIHDLLKLNNDLQGQIDALAAKNRLLENELSTEKE